MKKIPVRTLILAAGKGTRMQSDKVKVLHLLAGRHLLAYSLDVARVIGSEQIVVIVGHQAELVRRAFSNLGLVFIEQKQQLGTGHAVLQAKGQFSGYDGLVLILCGDVPCLKASTVQSLIDAHCREKAMVTVMTTVLEDPGGYGRVITDGEGHVMRIVEVRDASEEEKHVREINTGIYCVNSPFLFEAVSVIRNDNAQKEYYLTDIVEIACKRGHHVRSFVAEDRFEVMGINTPEDLATAHSHLAEA